MEGQGEYDGIEGMEQQIEEEDDEEIDEQQPHE